MPMRGNLGSASYTTLTARSIAVLLNLLSYASVYVGISDIKLMIYLVIAPEPVNRKYVQLLPLSTQHSLESK